MATGRDDFQRAAHGHRRIVGSVLFFDIRWASDVFGGPTKPRQTAWARMKIRDVLRSLFAGFAGLFRDI